MPDEDQYSTIRRESKLVRKNARFLSSFYDSLLRPHALLATVSVGVGLFWAQPPLPIFQAAIQGNAESELYLLMVVFTFLTGARLLQSIYLANRDYQRLEARFSDSFIFAAVIAFTAGAPVKLIPVKEVRWLALAYSALALFGAWNFLYLIVKRLPEEKPKIDYLIERRIQGLNILTFLHLAVAMFLVFASVTWSIMLPLLPIAAILSTFPSLILNMIHSSTLTLRPKFLYHNDEDSPDKSVARFREISWLRGTKLSDEEIKNETLGPEVARFQSVKLVRASREKVPQICDFLVTDFGYMFRFLFPDLDELRLRQILTCFLGACGGFGSFGFIWFYEIVDQTGSSVGFVKLETPRNWDIYLWLEQMEIPVTIARIVGPRALFQARKRAKAILYTQPKLGALDVAVTYIYIKPEARRKGMGSSVIRLLINALKAQSNDVLAARIRILVREGNGSAKSLFDAHGFVPDVEPGALPTQDPFVNVDGVGRPIYLVFDLLK